MPLKACTLAVPAGCIVPRSLPLLVLTIDPAESILAAAPKLRPPMRTPAAIEPYPKKVRRFSFVRIPLLKRRAIAGLPHNNAQHYILWRRKGAVRYERVWRPGL